MFNWWKRLGLQARFMLITSIGLLGVAVCVIMFVGWFEVSKVEQNLRDTSENELKSLNALVSSAMEQRATDKQDVAITVFNRWFEHRNVDHHFGPRLVKIVDELLRQQQFIRSAPHYNRILARDSIRMRIRQYVPYRRVYIG